MCQSILLIEDQALVRSSLAALINTTEHYRVCNAVGSIPEAIALLQQPDRFDLVLCDFNLQQDTAQSLLQARLPNLPPIILLTSLFNAIEIQSCMSLGARGFLFKEGELDEMLKAFADVLAGGVYFATQQIVRLSGVDNTADTLTLSEQEILRWLATGMSNKQIAIALGKSAETVKVQVAALMRKLQVRTRTQAVVKGAHLNRL